jgi:fucose permease
MKSKNATFINLIIMMVLLGISDSLRGVFIPVFQDTFRLDSKEASLIVTASYIGNLIFLFYGGYFVDRVRRKSAMMGILGLWMVALVIFITTDQYYYLLIGMFICMGASTLLSTTINITAPLLFVNSPGLIINVLGFTQGIGTSASQNLIGKAAGKFTTWQLVNTGLLAVGLLAFVMLTLIKLPDQQEKANEKIRGKVAYKEIFSNPAFIHLILIFGFYFIAEHGILNWLVSYASKELGYSMSSSSMYLSIFFVGITAGRLLLSPLVDRLGVFKSISIFGGVATVLYTAGALMGKNYLMLLSLSGICFSIIYPTLVLMIRKFYSADRIASATGTIISIATLFDIGFNMLFGVLTDYIGFKISFLILPVSMVVFYGCYWRFKKHIKV